MMRSLFAGVSGLTSHQTRMDVIGNNIANVNTIGYKKSRVTFQDMLSQTVRNATAPSATRGGVNPMQVGLGVQLGTIDVNHTEGATEPTGVSTDMSIRGNGFFVLLDGQRQLFSRAGAFDLDEMGWLFAKGTGIRVAGWNADNSGNINTNQPLQQIRVSIAETVPARATTAAELEGNLDAEEAISAAIGSSVPTSVSVTDSTGATRSIDLEFRKIDFKTWVWMASEGGTPLDIDGVTPTPDPADERTWPELRFNSQGQLDAAASQIGDIFVNVGGTAEQISFVGDLRNAISEEIQEGRTVSTTVEAFDSLGVEHSIIVEFEKIGPNTWVWWAPNENDPANPFGQGTMTFSNQGILDLTSITSTTVTMQGTPGSDPLQFDLDFSRLSQYGGETGVDMRIQDGFGAGKLEEVQIDAAGVLTGVFSNGLTRALAQIGLATFSNNGGLLRAGESMFEQSRNSGLAQIGAAGTADRGFITPGTLEMSNVDLSEEFTSMIITQRGFQANSRIITTSDEMLQELVNLKR